MPQDKYVAVNLEKIVEQLSEEARTILPGIQALFGFQLISVFSERFMNLTAADRICHFIALICTAVAVLCVLSPAAYSRQAEPNTISTYFCRLGSRMLTLAMLPLAIALSLDLYVVAELIVGNYDVALATGILSFLALMYAWFLFPQMKKRRVRKQISQLK